MAKPVQNKDESGHSWVSRVADEYRAMSDEELARHITAVIKDMRESGVDHDYDGAILIDEAVEARLQERLDALSGGVPGTERVANPGKE